MNEGKHAQGGFSPRLLFLCFFSSDFWEKRKTYWTMKKTKAIKPKQ